MAAFRRFRLVVLVATVLLATLLPASPVRALSITVTTTTDEFDLTGTGTGCSLREAVQAANSDAPFGGCSQGSGADVITMPSGTYGFALGGSESATMGYIGIGDLDVDGVLTIVGQGHPTIDGNSRDRIFELNDSGDSLTLRGLILTDGYGLAAGGAIKAVAATLSLVDVVVSLNTASDGSSADGGGIWAAASTVSIAGSEITGNSAAPGPTFPSDGGGIWAVGTTLTVTDSLIGANTAQRSGGGIHTIDARSTTLTNVAILSNKAMDGDGISITGAGNATLTNVTIAFNGQGASGKGGGMYASPSRLTSVALENVTFSNNLGGPVGGDGGSIYVEPAALGTVTAKNTIAAHPQAGGNCGGKSLSYTNAHNLEFVPGGTASPCFSQGVDPTTVLGDPKFPLDGVGNIASPAENGGPTATLALGPSSAALDAGITAFGVTSDQRGVPRPYGSAPDIGAYERSFCRDVLINRVGTPANDTITGTAGPDGIIGLGGNDSISGLGGNDGLCGNGGNDLLDGGSGNDRLDGGGNTDTLVPGTGVDLVVGAGGSDTVSYAASNSAVSVDLRPTNGFATGQGRDTINGVENVTGSRFADTVRGSNLANLLRLGAGADRGYGYGGADRIDGGPGGDSLFGGTGNDALYGEAGNDSFNGEAGRDLCRQGPGSGRRISCERR